MSEGALDYIVVKPAKYDFGQGEVMLEQGTIIPGAIAETWGNGLMHLLNLGRLAPTPAVEDDHPRKFDVTSEPPVIVAAGAIAAADAPEAEAEAEVEGEEDPEPEIEQSDDEPEAEEDEVTPVFPQHKAAGVFTLSDGSEVKGKKAAIDAQAALDAAAADAPEA